MRENAKFGAIDANRPVAEGAVPADEAAYFASFYEATVRGEPTDRMTIGPVTEWESRFHYNAVENAILRAVARLEPVPEPAMIAAWAMLKQRKKARQLDIGSGTGHWIDFGRDVLFAGSATGLELTPKMAEFLTAKYADCPEIRIATLDLVDASPAELGGPFDLVTAIGVMFHIIADERWERAIANIAGAMAPGALAFFGGDFGAVTADRQFMRTDTFRTWREYAGAGGGPAKVTRRVRSLARWCAVAAANGLDVVDVVRTDRLPEFTVPENDVLVLRKPAL